MSGDTEHNLPVSGLASKPEPAVDRDASGYAASPIDDMDMRTFTNWLARAIHGDPDVPPSILAIVGEATQVHGGGVKKRDSDWWEAYAWQRVISEQLKEIDRLIARYGEMADWHHAEAEKARQKMRESGDKLAAIDEFVSGVNDVLKEKEESGKFDKEKAIKLLKTRGVDAAPNEADGSLLIKLENEKKKADGERVRWSEQYDRARADADYNDRMEREDRNKARELTQKRDEILKQGRDSQEQSQQLEKLTDEYNVDVQLKAADLEKGKIHPDQAASLTAVAERTVDGSQNKNEEADFLGSADDLTAKFSVASSGVPKETQSAIPSSPSAPLVNSGPSV